MELIDKQELLKRLKNWHKECAADASKMGGEAVLLAEGLADAIAAVEDAPVVRDVAPVVHGRWIFDSGNEYVDHYHCDKCGEEIDLCNEVYTEPTPNYCPNCGAKMDKEATDEQ